MRNFRLSPGLARLGLCAAPDFVRNGDEPNRAWPSRGDRDRAAEAGQGAIARVNMAQCVLRETVERTPWLEARRG